jgi:ATP-dependent DNA ligase
MRRCASGSASICAPTTRCSTASWRALTRRESRSSTSCSAAAASRSSSAFDLLWLNGRDFRDRPLVDRKAALRTLIRNGGRILYADHIDGQGTELYRAACRQDLEGIVAKHKWSGYVPDPTLSSWVKIKNPAYSQAAGRHEQFTRYRRLAL